MRLWLMKETREVEIALKALIQVIVNRADKERDILMPGYTHLQVYPRGFPLSTTKEANVVI